MLNLDNQNLYFFYHYRRVQYAIFNQKYSINLILSQCLRAAYIQPLRHNRQRATTSKANTKAKRRQNQQRKQLSSPTDGAQQERPINRSMTNDLLPQLPRT